MSTIIEKQKNFNKLIKEYGWPVNDLSAIQWFLRGQALIMESVIPASPGHCNRGPEDGLGKWMSTLWECPSAQKGA